VCCVARPHTHRHEGEYRGHPFRISGIFPSTYHQGSVQYVHNDTMLLSGSITFSTLVRLKILITILYVAKRIIETDQLMKLICLHNSINNIFHGLFYIYTYTCTYTALHTCTSHVASETVVRISAFYYLLLK